MCWKPSWANQKIKTSKYLKENRTCISGIRKQVTGILYILTNYVIDTFKYGIHNTYLILKLATFFSDCRLQSVKWPVKLEYCFSFRKSLDVV